MQNENISKKEYCDKKWSLLKPHAEVNIVKQIQQLQVDLEATNILEVSLINQQAGTYFLPALRNFTIVISFI